MTILQTDFSGRTEPKKPETPPSPEPVQEAGTVGRFGEKRRDQRGFSLIEIMIVMVIIGLLASLVGPKMFGQLGKAKQKTAKAQIEMLMTALDAYRLDAGKYPSQQEGLEALITNPGNEDWAGPYLAKKAVPLDPWKRPFIFRSPGENGEVDISTLGADGQVGGSGEDTDVNSWD